MNYPAFVAKWNGKQVTAYGSECVALVAQYCVENNKPFAWANAKDWANNPALYSGWTWVANGATNVPSQGDLVVWNGGLPGSGGYGHIAIFDRRAGAGVFVSFDQNWSGRQAHFVTHGGNYANVAGWWTPKVVQSNPVTQGDNTVFQNIAQVEKAYIFLRGVAGTLAEMQAWIGRPIMEFFTIGLAEANSRRQQLIDTLAQVANMQKAINDQNKIITDLNTGAVSSKKEYQEAVAQLATLTSQLESLHDQIEDLQKKPVAPVLPQEPQVTTWQSVIDFFRTQINKFLKKG